MTAHRLGGYVPHPVGQVSRSQHACEVPHVLLCTPHLLFLQDTRCSNDTPCLSASIYTFGIRSPPRGMVRLLQLDLLLLLLQQ